MHIVYTVIYVSAYGGQFRMFWRFRGEQMQLNDSITGIYHKMLHH
jgi:hypothetical protein